MIYVVKMDGQENTVLARYEAWDTDCMEKATKFIAENNLKFVYDEVNLNGDMILWCE